MKKNFLSLDNINELLEELDAFIDTLKFELENRKRGPYPIGKVDEFQAIYRSFDQASHEWREDPAFENYKADIVRFGAKISKAFDLLFELRRKTIYVID